jgi:hypothetical protein
MIMDNLQPGGYKTTSIGHATAYNYGGGWTHVFRPSLILDLRGGTNDRYFDEHTDSTVGLGPMKQMGFIDVDRFNGMRLGLLAPWRGRLRRSGSEVEPGLEHRRQPRMEQGQPHHQGRLPVDQRRASSDQR